MSTDAVESVIAVEPCTTAAKDIAHTPFRRMTAETVDVSSFSIFGHLIPVVPGIAVQEQVVRPADEIDTNGLAIMHSQSFKDIVAPLAFKADRLSVRLDGDLHPGDFNPLQSEP